VCQQTHPSFHRSGKSGPTQLGLVKNKLQLRRQYPANAFIYKMQKSVCLKREKMRLRAQLNEMSDLCTFKSVALFPILQQTDSAATDAAGGQLKKVAHTRMSPLRPAC
jgi:hypothetical protein